MTTNEIARFNENDTGLNIYNPYFRAAGLKAKYILRCGYNPLTLTKLMRSVRMPGAVVSGFETNPDLRQLVDKETDAVRASGRIGYIINQDGVLTADYQAGKGLSGAIGATTDIHNSRVVLVGAGAVARAFCSALETSGIRPGEVVIVNRTPVNAEKLASDSSLPIKVAALSALQELTGDILINATPIGSLIKGPMFTPDVVSRFGTVVDVTFGNPNTDLIQEAISQGIPIVHGWNIFAHHVGVVIQNILNHTPNMDILQGFVSSGLAESNHAAKLTHK